LIVGYFESYIALLYFKLKGKSQFSTFSKGTSPLNLNTVLFLFLLLY